MKTLAFLLLSVVSVVAQFGSGTPQIPTANLFIKYDLNEGSGQRLANSVHPGSLVNLVPAPENSFARSQFWSGNFTPTDGYAANPITGTLTASRLLASAGSWKNLEGVVFGAAGQYTLSAYVVSNTGANQTFRFYVYSGGYKNSGDLTATTTWQRFTYTFTATAAVENVYFSNDTSTASDIIVYGMQLEPGASASAYLPANYNAILGVNLGTNSSDPVWTSNKTLNFAGAVKYTFATGEPVVCSNATVYALVNWTSTPQVDGYAPIFNFSTNSATLRNIGLNNTSSSTTNNSCVAYFGPTGTTNAQSVYSQVPLSNWVVAAMSYDGTSIKAFINDQVVCSFSNPGDSVTVDRLFLSSFAFAQNWPGEIGYFLAYNAAHSQSQMAEVCKSLQVQANRKGFPYTTAKKFVLFQGDSITSGLGVVNGYAYLASMSNSIPHLNTAQIALGGRRLELDNGGVISVVNMLATVNGYLSVNSKTKVLSLLIGANDLGLGTYATGADYYAALKSCCLLIKSMGWKVCLGTIIANSSSTINTKRNACNTLIRGDNSFWDALADYDTTAMGVDANGSDATYFIDGTHPTAYGHYLMAPVCATALNSL